MEHIKLINVGSVVANHIEKFFNGDKAKGLEDLAHNTDFTVEYLTGSLEAFNKHY